MTDIKCEVACKHRVLGYCTEKEVTLRLNLVKIECVNFEESQC